VRVKKYVRAIVIDRPTPAHIMIRITILFYFIDRTELSEKTDFERIAGPLLAGKVRIIFDKVARENSD
jgi:hypothetical protein